MSGRGFIIFQFFYYFFRNFLARVESERNSGLKFCFHFFGLSHPVLAKNNSRKSFYDFLNIFTIFLEFSCPGRVRTELGTKFFFFFLFFGLSHPIFGKNNAGKRFYNFLNFFYYFFGIFLPRSSTNGIRD